jgi:PTS system nitrogen regulatory IIA component
MQLTVRDVSEFLDVSEATVTRWIKQRGLPAHHVGGQFRFHRAELLEWATANQIKVSAALFDQLEQEDDPVPTLAEALETGGIFDHLRAQGKHEALQALVQVLPVPEHIDRADLLRLFLARESLMTTAIGNGVALPHVRNPIVVHVEQPLVTLCFLEQPVDFGALDGQPVSVLFALVCPTVRSHLQTLSRLSHALRDDGFRAAVMRRAARDEILREARRLESSATAMARAADKVSR